MRIHRIQRRQYVVPVGLSALLAACDSSDIRDASEADVTAIATTVTAAADYTPTSAHWTYDGEEGPEHWGGLDTKYVECREGESQSPIDLASTVEQDLTNIDFSYQPSAVNIRNNGHTILVEYDAGSSISVNDTQFDLLQFHFHSPSEHTNDGAEHAAELHLVHGSAEGALAVVGVFIDTGAENSALAPV